MSDENAITDFEVTPLTNYHPYSFVYNNLVFKTKFIYLYIYIYKKDVCYIIDFNFYSNLYISLILLSILYY